MFVSFVASENTVIHEFATLCLAALSVDFVSSTQIFENNGLPLLIVLLSSSDPDVKKNSLEVIFNLVQVTQSTGPTVVSLFFKKKQTLSSSFKTYPNTCLFLFFFFCFSFWTFVLSVKEAPQISPGSTWIWWDSSAAGSAEIQVPRHSASGFKDSAVRHNWWRHTQHLQEQEWIWKAHGYPPQPGEWKGNRFLVNKFPFCHFVKLKGEGKNVATEIYVFIFHAVALWSWAPALFYYYYFFQEFSDLHIEALQVVANCLSDPEAVQQIHKGGGLERLMGFILTPNNPEIQSTAITCLSRVAQNCKHIYKKIDEHRIDFINVRC